MQIELAVDRETDLYQQDLPTRIHHSGRNPIVADSVEEEVGADAVIGIEDEDQIAFMTTGTLATQDPDLRRAGGVGIEMTETTSISTRIHDPEIREMIEIYEIEN